jgi:hemerythrin superfamily protein
MSAKKTAARRSRVNASSSKATAVLARRKVAAQATTRSSIGGSDALTLLHRDHETVGALIDEVRGCKPGDRRLPELAQAIAQALTVHAEMEEDFFYPKLRDRSDKGEQLTDVFEAYTEHDAIKHLVALLKSDKTRNEKFKAELQVLGEEVKRHVKEEESTIFKLARKLMSREELDNIGAGMAKEKERLGKSSVLA